MKFNDHELSLFASTRLGKADKEGCLWMREVEGKIRKKQSKLSCVLGGILNILVVCADRLCAEMVSTLWKFTLLLQNRDPSNYILNKASQVHLADLSHRNPLLLE